jgi:hypothetical protein
MKQLINNTKAIIEPITIALDLTFSCGSLLEFIILCIRVFFELLIMPESKSNNGFDCYFMLRKR